VASKSAFRSNRVRDVEAGKSFVMHSAELIASLAWKGRSIHAVRLLDRLELENCAQAGHENGDLIVTYNQFVKYGIGRRFLRRAIEEAVELGLLRVTQQGLYRGGARGHPSRYRLTYLKSKVVPSVGARYYVPPTNEWRAVIPNPTRSKSGRMVTTGEPSKFTTGELGKRRNSSNVDGAAKCTPGELLSISRSRGASQVPRQAGLLSKRGRMATDPIPE
jgi:hypothetical protein